MRGLEIRQDGRWLKVDQPQQRAYSQVAINGSLPFQADCMLDIPRLFGNGRA